MALLYFIILLDTTVSYSAERLIYNFETNKILLIKQAKVYYSNVKVCSDSLVYDTETKDVLSYKKSVLYIDKDTIYGEVMGYNLESGKGIIFKGKGKVKKGWFNGEEIKLVAPKTLNINTGKFTTCELTPPHYYFWAKDLKVYIDDMVYAKPVVLCVQDIPVFVLPFWFFPIKKERSSGLLYPQIGRDSYLGRYIKNVSYYWVISDYADLTLGVDYMEKKGLGINLSTIWLYKPIFSANLDINYVDESGLNKRWKLDGIYRHNFRNGTVAIGKADFISDLSFNVDYGENVIKELEQVLSSYLSISRRFGPISSSFLLRETRNIKNDERSGDYPRINFSLPSKRMFGGYLSYSGLLLNSIKNGEGEKESQNNLRFALSNRIWYFNLSPGTEIKFTMKDKTQPYRSYDASISITTALYGRSLLANPQIRHIATPSFCYGISRSDGSYTRNMGISMHNEFNLMFWDRGKINLGFSDIGTSWNFDNKSWNPLKISASASSFFPVSLRVGGIWDPYEHIVYDRYLITSYKFSYGNFRANLSYNIKEKGNNSIWGTFHLKPTKGWTLEGGARYDFREERLVSEKISLKRDLHCWELMFNYEKYGERWDYNIKLHLKAIPEIKVGKDIVKMLIGE